MKRTCKAILLFAVLVSFAVVSANAQGKNEKPPKGKAQTRGRMYVFGQVKDWKADSTRKLTPSDDYKIVLNSPDPIVEEADNMCRFVVVPRGPGKARDFLVSLCVDGRDRFFLVSEEAFSDAKGFYFKFGPTELGRLKPGKHTLMLIIDAQDQTLVRTDDNQYSIGFTVK
jgi:hypothetical protein